MINEIEKYELIEKYLLNTASEEEKKLIEDLLINDPEFKKEVEIHRELQNVIIDYKLIELKTKLQKIHNKSIKNINGKNLTFILTGIIVISTILYFTFRRNDKLPSPDPEASNASGSLMVVDTITSDSIKNKSQSSSNKKINIGNDFNKNKITSENNDSLILDKQNTTDKNITEEKNIKIENKTYDTINQSKETVEKQEYKICKLLVSYSTEPSCNTHPSGKIEIIEESIRGGTPPYSLFINNKKYPLKIENLSPGIYQIKLIDNNNCIFTDNVKIDVENCFKEFVFSPSHNEMWEIPVKDGKRGTIKIYDRNGKLVFQKTITSNYETWDGNDINNIPLPSGLYPFIIYYNDGEIYKGSVTIIR